MLADLLRRRYRRRRIERIHTRPSAYSSTCRLYEVDVRLDDGRELALVWKDLGSASEAAGGTRVGPRSLYEPRREIEVYRRVLRHSRDGTPKLLGGVISARRPRHWLFVERVRGIELPQVGDFGIWLATAAWLGSFHRRFASAAARRGLQRARLLDYDRELLGLWTDRIRRRLATGALTPRRDVDRVLDAYERSLPELAKLPRTLIHGELFPANIVVDAAAKTPRICPVDWETAGVGPGLIDLAMLAAGNWHDDQIVSLLAAYDAAVSGRARVTRVSETLGHAFTLCRLHVAIRMLGWSAERDWHPPRQHAHDWLRSATAITNRL